jgi:glycerophosphoryl diester phosphodiesterase
MNYFEIVAHRGIPIKVPENTIEAFTNAIKHGVDAVEFDVRLTADQIPIVYHYYYLEELTNFSGPVFNFTYKQLRDAKFIGNYEKDTKNYKIPSLETVLEVISSKIGLEIEIKGPEPESADIIVNILKKFKHLHNNLEITSYEPFLLRKVKKHLPNLKIDLLFPLYDKWMKSDVISYLAIQHARIAKANSIHLHPIQLNQKIIQEIKKKGYQVHTWDVNDEETIKKVVELKINRICTDNCLTLMEFRQKYLKHNNV